MNININGVNIILTNEQLAQIDEQVKKLNTPPKPSHEERFWQLCQDLTMKIDREKYPDSIFFFKEDECWFEYDTKTNYLWCKYKHVWSVFEDKYSMKYAEIQSLIKRLVEEHFRLKGVTPYLNFAYNAGMVEEHFRLKGVTPESFSNIKIPMIEEHFKLKGVTPE